MLASEPHMDTDNNLSEPQLNDDVIWLTIQSVGAGLASARKSHLNAFQQTLCFQTLQSLSVLAHRFSSDARRLLFERLRLMAVGKQCPESKIVQPSSHLGHHDRTEVYKRGYTLDFANADNCLHLNRFDDPARQSVLPLVRSLSFGIERDPYGLPKEAPISTDSSESDEPLMDVDTPSTRDHLRMETFEEAARFIEQLIEIRQPHGSNTTKKFTCLEIHLCGDGSTKWSCLGPNLQNALRKLIHIENLTDVLSVFHCEKVPQTLFSGAKLDALDLVHVTTLDDSSTVDASPTPGAPTASTTIAAWEPELG